VAKQIAIETTADRIVKLTVDVDYGGVTGAMKSGNSLLTSKLPEITTKLPDLAHYDVIYIGAPVWFGSVPPPLRALLQRVDFGNKKVVVFSTCTRSGAAGFNAQFKKLAKGGNIVLTDTFKQKGPKATLDEQVRKWSDEL
jgi:NAD(P)H-dependent FMN reductase